MKNIKKYILFSLIIIMIFALSLSIVSCQKENEVVNVNEDVTIVEESTPEGNPVPGGELTVVLPSVIDNLNPLLANNEDVINFLGLIYESPLYIDNTGQFMPVLVESWEVDESGKSYTFVLRKDIQFHDGHDLKSDDIISTINQIFAINNDEGVVANDTVGTESQNTDSEDIDNEIQDNNNDLETNTETKSRYAKYNSLIESVKRVDDYTLTINMKKRGREALYFICFPVLPENYDSNNTLNGTGPYKYYDTDDKGNISVVVNDKWWKTKPYIDKIIGMPIDNLSKKIQYIQNNDIDIITTNSIASNKYRSDNVNVSDYETYYYDCLIPNLFKEDMKDINIRKAISFAVDRRQIISTVLLNRGVSSEMPVSPNFYAYNIKYKQYEFDNVAACDLIEESGFDSKISETGNTDYNLTIDLIVPNEIGFEYRLEVARIIADNLADVGIICNIEKLSPNDYLSRLENNNYDLAYCSYYLGANPDITEILGTGKSLNYGNVASSDLDAILNDCSEAVTDDEIIASYDKLQQYLSEKVPQIGLFYRRFSALYNSRINDISIEHENTLYNTINNWYLAKIVDN